MRSGFARMALVCALGALPRQASAQMYPEVLPALKRIAGAVIAAHAQHADPRAIERRWGGLLPHDARALHADTLDGRVLLACCGGSRNLLGVAVIAGDRVILSRRAPDRIELRDDWTAPMSLERVFLVHPAGRAGAPGPWCALFWCLDAGTGAPYNMRGLVLEPRPRMASIREVVYGPGEGWFVGAMGAGSTCKIVARRGDVRWRVYERERRYTPAHVHWPSGQGIPEDVTAFRLARLRPFRARVLSRRHVEHGQWVP